MRRYVVVFLIFVFPCIAQGAQQMQYSWNPGFFYLNLDDPDGSTRAATGFVPLAGSLFYEYARDTRLYVDVQYLDFSIDPGVNLVGQGVTSYQIGLYQQSLIRFTEFKIWGGYGLVLQQSKYKKRYTVDSDGFTAAHYPDRTVSNPGLALNCQKQWKYNAHVSLGFSGQYFYTMNHGMNGAILSFMAVF